MARGDHDLEQVPTPTLAGDEDRILCKLAVKHRMVTEDQLEEVSNLVRQEGARGESLSMGDAMLRLKVISRRQLDALERAKKFTLLRKPDRLTIRILLRNALAAQADIDSALQYQARLYKKTGEFKPIGDLLLERGQLTARQHRAVQSAVTRCRTDASRTCSYVEAEAESPAPNLPPASREKSELPLSTPIQGTEESAFEESAVELKISPDRLMAALVLNRELPPHYSAADLRDYLRSRDVVYGILDDSALTKIIRSPWEPGKAFRVAQGTPPEPPQAAEIRYLVEPRLDADLGSELAGESVIDLKERGMIPQVRKGEVMARKIPYVPGIPGIDVHGQEIVIPEGKDVPLLIGSGVELSADRLEAVAVTDGRPQISAFGRLSVLPELVIRGDVSFETGNVDFAGSIVVAGVIQDGFKVRGGSLIASEIGKADIDVEGDIVVFGGILGARVRTQAALKSMHVHASQVEAMGDVLVEKGVVDSRISTSGKFILRKGTILASSIIARRGIEAVHVGSERSKPCTFGIGFDPISERQAEARKVLLGVEREEAENQQAHIDSLKPQLEEVEKRIGELAQEQDRALRQQRSVLARIREADSSGDAQRAETLRRELQVIDGRSEEAARNLDKLLEWQDQLKSVIAGYRDRIREIEGRIAQLNSELAAILDWSAANKARPVIKVHGTIVAGTSIKGPFSSVTLKDDHTGVAFVERSDAEANGPGAGSPRIVMQRLRR